MENNKLIVPDGIVISKIYYIRDQKVMLDSDLAALYEVETKQLKRPDDFMLRLIEKEYSNLKSQFATSS